MAAEILFWESPQKKGWYRMGLLGCVLMGMGAFYLILCTAQNWWLGFGRSLTGKLWGGMMGVALVLAVLAVWDDTVLCRRMDTARKNRLVITSRRVYGLAQGKSFEYPLWQVQNVEEDLWQPGMVWLRTMEGDRCLLGIGSPQQAALAWRNAVQASGQSVAAAHLPVQSVQAGLVLSKESARGGALCELALPGYEPVSVRVPAGAHNGTILCLPRVVMTEKGKAPQEKSLYITLYVQGE